MTVGATTRVDVTVSVNTAIDVETGGNVDVGKTNCKVGEAGMTGLSSGADGGADSARASEIPPTTRMMETMAMITPPPT